MLERGERKITRLLMPSGQASFLQFIDNKFRGFGTEGELRAPLIATESDSREITNVAPGLVYPGDQGYQELVEDRDVLYTAEETEELFKPIPGESWVTQKWG